MSVETNLGEINCVFDWTCPSDTQGEGFTHRALSVYSRGRRAGCLAEGLWIGLRSAWLQLWAESWSACLPLYGNEQGQSEGSAGQEFSSMFLQRAAVCKLCFPLLFLLQLGDSTSFHCVAFVSYHSDIFHPPKPLFSNISSSILLQLGCYLVFGSNAVLGKKSLTNLVTFFSKKLQFEIQ